MSRNRYKIYDPEYPYFLTSSIVEGFPLFSNSLAAKTILEGLDFVQQERKAKLFAYVIMENHIHLIAQSSDLSKHMRAFKSWTARTIIDRFIQNGHTRQLARLRRAKKHTHTDSDHQVWKEGFHPKQIISDGMMVQKIDYIHNNPVKRGFVDRPEDWRYTSARNYRGIEGLVPVTLYHR